MYKKIYVPVDNSDHSNAAIELSVALAKALGASIVGNHVYAAQMHDKRFRQMEYTLPPEYIEEHELERQRKIHDSLITMGLQLISDSYLDVLKKNCEENRIPFEARTMDGKHFEMIVKDIRENDCDLVVMGALGTGAVKESVLGSVAERVSRRIQVDTLIVKDTRALEEQLKSNGEGPAPIVVAIDGSPQSYAALQTAIRFAQVFQRPLEAVGVYDPYLHYTVFDGIVGVLSEKASKVFRFKEQEQLHEEIIDTGLAKIYQSHLEVAQGVAKEQGVELKITLMDGKAFEKVLQHVRKAHAWMLFMGRIGYHSRDDMDIGSNSENLLRLAPCHVFLSSRKFIPPLDLKADAAITWTPEALERMIKVPEFVRGIARTAVLRYAMERGHSVITHSVIEEVMKLFMPQKSVNAMGQVALDLAIQEVAANRAAYLCENCGHIVKDVKPVVCGVCEAPAEKFKLIDKTVLENIVKQNAGDLEKEETFDGTSLRWTPEARELLLKVPAGYMRRRAKARIEKSTRVRNQDIVTPEIARAVVEEVAEEAKSVETASPPAAVVMDGLTWTPEAVARLERVPQGFMREETRKVVVGYAQKNEKTVVTLEVAENGIAEARKVMEQMIRGYGSNP